MTNALTRTRRRARNARGFSMPETLVWIVLLAAVSAIVTGIVMHANTVSRNTSASSTTQSQLLDAVSRVTRDVAFADPILFVEKNSDGKNPAADAPNGTELWTQTKRVVNNVTTCLQARYWVAQDEGITDAANFDALWSYTWTYDGDCTGRVRPTWGIDDQGKPFTTTGRNPGKAVVHGLQKGKNGDLFTYFDNNGDQITPDPAKHIEQISRVQIKVVAAVSGRTDGLTLVTSASPRTGLLTGGKGSETGKPSLPQWNSVDATFACLDGTVTISWVHDPSTLGYTMFRDDVPQAEVVSLKNDPVRPGVQIASFTQRSVPTGTTPTYQVVAYGSGGWIYSPKQVVACAPSAPVLSGTTVDDGGDGNVNDDRLTWTMPGNQVVTGYYVYPVTGTGQPILNGAGQPVRYQPAPITTKTYVNQNLIWGSTNYYQVSAYNTSATGVIQEGVRSNTVALLIRPAKPNLTGSTTNGDRLLTWTMPAPVGTVTGYEVERRVDSTATTAWQRVQTYTGAQAAGASFTWTDTATYNGDLFEYRVRAYNASGRSAYSATLALHPRPAIPVLKGSHVNGDRTLTWNSTANADSYVLERSVNDGAWTTVTTITGQKTGTVAYTDTSATRGVKFEYRVTASNKTGTKGPSSIITLYPNPGATSLTVWSTDDGWNHLKWTPSPNATCYNVYRDGALYWHFDDTRTTADDGAPGWGSAHTYAVEGCNKTGEGPRAGAGAVYQNPSRFDIVAGDTRQWMKYTDKNGNIADNYDGGAKVGWTPSAGATRYDVIMDGWNRFNVGNTTWSSPDINVWTPGATVTYQVVAITDIPGQPYRERWSNPVTVIVPPAPPANVAASTWCKYDVKDKGWKYGMDIVPVSPVGPVDWVHILETRYRASNGLNSPWEYYYVNHEQYIPPVNAWQTYAWGGLPDNNGDNVISNVRWEGGGMLAETLKNGSATFGNNWSARLGIDGAIKGVTGAVKCSSSHTVWSYNDDPNVVQRWNWFQ